MNELVRMISEDGTLYVLALNSTEMVKEMQNIHGTSKVCSAALGRLITAASMMGVLLKGENDTLTLKISGNGPASPVVAVSNSKGSVKGYIGDRNVELPLNNKGKLDVSGAVGKDGFLTVIKDLGLREPYCAQIPIASGEIAEDITAYYAVSEQTPTVCALGVLVDPDTKDVLLAGGFLIQLLPTADENTISLVEKGLENIQPVTTMLANGLTPEDIGRAVLPEFSMQVLDRENVEYKCDCSKERVTAALIGAGEDGLREMAEDEQTEVVCHFCNKKYIFPREDILKLLKEASK
ncbi:MAG: Hsp33 family molecular chaperone HslO [Oscillospiraceae bacterium]|nr:Hsp33 family molecular chaperone HslO [Oscillospiraceae bacterium]